MAAPSLPEVSSDDMAPPAAGTATKAAGTTAGPAEIAAARQLGRSTMQKQLQNYQRFQECHLGAENARLLAEPLASAWPPLEQRMLAGDGGAAEALLERASMCESLRTSAKLAPGPERDRMLAEFGDHLDPATTAMIDSISAEAVAWFDRRTLGCGDGDFGMARLAELVRRRAIASGHPEFADSDPKGGLLRPQIFDLHAKADAECKPRRYEARLMAGDAAPLPPDLLAIALDAVPPDSALGSALAECQRRACRSLVEVPGTLQQDLSALAEHLGLDDDVRWRIDRERADQQYDAVFGWQLYLRWLLMNSCEAFALPQSVAQVSRDLQATAAHLDAGQRQRGLALAQQLAASYGSAALRVRGCGG